MLLLETTKLKIKEYSISCDKYNYKIYLTKQGWCVIRWGIDEAPIPPYFKKMLKNNTWISVMKRYETELINNFESVNDLLFAINSDKQSVN